LPTPPHDPHRRPRKPRGNGKVRRRRLALPLVGTYTGASRRGDDALPSDAPLSGGAAVFQGRWPGRKLSAQDAAKIKTWSDRAPGRPLLLPRAVRPAGPLDWPLREGYRVEVYKDAALGLRMPVM